MEGVTVVCYEIWSKDGQTLLMTVWVKKDEDAARIAYLLDGAACKDVVGVVYPE